MEKILLKVQELFAMFGLKVIAAIVIIVLGRWIAKLIRNITKKIMKKSKVVRKVIMDVLSKDERILKEPQATVGVLELADSSVNFAVRPWVKTPDYWNVYFDVTENIKKAFDSQNISIPFPQQDVHLYKDKLEVT